MSQPTEYPSPQGPLHVLRINDDLILHVENLRAVKEPYHEYRRYWLCIGIDEDHVKAILVGTASKNGDLWEFRDWQDSLVTHLRCYHTSLEQIEHFVVGRTGERLLKRLNAQ